jgi:hypothetical protein
MQNSTSTENDEIIQIFISELKKLNIYNPERMDSFFLTRFLKARKFILADSVVMLEASEKWRIEFKVDELVESFAFPEADEVQKLYTRFHHKTDKLGRPIYVESFKDMDFKKLMACTTEERISKHHVREFEKFISYKMAACSKKAGRNIDQGFTIFDLQGIPLSSFTSVKRLGSEISKVISNFSL